jgi:hypothetical protein
MIVAFERDDFRARAQHDHGVLFNAANEIPRHRIGEPLATN